MFVEGFILDEIQDVDPPASAGVIPEAWLKRGKAHSARDPDTFWKTLVADRSPHGNALPYYKNAIEAALKDADGRSFNTGSKISTRTSEIVTVTLQQVQATVWERCLFETSRQHLGLGPSKTQAGDLVCILYGCSVPVILRRHVKTQAQLDLEALDDEKELVRRQDIVVAMYQKLSNRKARLEPVKPPANNINPPRVPEGDAAKTEPEKAGAGQKSVLHANDPHEDKFGRQIAWIRSHDFPALFSVTRVLMLTVLCMSVAWLNDEELSASILAAFAVPHVLVDIYTFSNSIQAISPRSLAIVVAALTVFVAMLLTIFADVTSMLAFARVQTDHLRAVQLVTLLYVLFPEGLPDRTRRLFRRWYDWGTVLLATSIAALTRTEANEPSREISIEMQPEAGKATELVRKPVAIKPKDEPPLLDEYYTLVGESYVHEMMNGAAIQWQNESVLNQREQVESQTFELR